MRKKGIYHIFAFFVFLFFSSCDGSLVLGSGSTIDDGATANITGEPSQFSQEIYETSNLAELCLFEECLPDYEELPDDFREFYDSDVPDICAYDEDPNRTSQFILKHESAGIDGLDLLMSKEDLFFLAWVSMRYQINPHFLLGVMAQESYGNCAAVSFADAEGCFQITNDYGRDQLEESYFERVLGWHWNENPSGYYSEDLFIDPLQWFGEEPETDQFRMTKDPRSGVIEGVELSSVINFHFGVIGSGLLFQWEQYFLYHNYESLRDNVINYISDDVETKASLMAAAYNGGIGRLTSSLQSYDEDYLDGMTSESQNYVDRVLSYCNGFQGGDSVYQATYNNDEIDYIIDLLSYTYDGTANIDWTNLKIEIEENFFSTQEELTLVDDVKALIYFISTYDSALGPEWPAL